MLELGPHQLEAIEKLGNGSILCGGVGSGKSRAAIGYYYFKVCGGLVPVNGEGSVERMKSPKKLYVITTARKRESLDWLKECALFGVSSNPEDHVDGVSVVVDSWNNIKKYTDLKDSFVIFDEQRLVGTGVWVKSFYKIAAKNEWILLSATPGDVWLDYVPVFVANGFFKNITQFKDYHVVYDHHSKFPKVKKYLGTKKLERLRDHILVDMPVERHTVRNEKIVVVGYDKDRFDLVMKKRWNIFEEKPIENKAEYFHLMRKVVNSDPSRVDAVCDIFEKRQKRLIIFYTFNYELELLRDLGDILGVEVAEWNGHKHEPVPEGDAWIYLVQYVSASEAWNCTVTDTIIFYSLSYSYKIMEQSRGRIDRLNTPFTDLYYYTLRSGSPIDAAIMKSLREKKSFNESAFRVPE